YGSGTDKPDPVLASEEERAPQRDRPARPKARAADAVAAEWPPARGVEDRGEIVANRVGDRVRRRFPARCAMLPAHVTRRNGLSSRPCGLRLPSRAPQETRPAFHAFDYTDVGR